MQLYNLIRKHVARLCAHGPGRHRLFSERSRFRLKAYTRVAFLERRSHRFGRIPFRRYVFRIFKVARLATENELEACRHRHRCAQINASKSLISGSKENQVSPDLKPHSGFRVKNGNFGLFVFVETTSSTQRVSVSFAGTFFPSPTKQVFTCSEIDTVFENSYERQSVFRFFKILFNNNHRGTTQRYIVTVQM